MYVLHVWVSFGERTEPIPAYEENTSKAVRILYESVRIERSPGIHRGEIRVKYNEIFKLKGMLEEAVIT